MIETNWSRVIADDFFFGFPPSIATALSAFTAAPREKEMATETLLKKAPERSACHLSFKKINNYNKINLFFEAENR